MQQIQKHRSKTRLINSKVLWVLYGMHYTMQGNLEFDIPFSRRPDIEQLYNAQDKPSVMTVMTVMSVMTTIWLGSHIDSTFTHDSTPKKEKKKTHIF